MTGEAWNAGRLPAGATVVAAADTARRATEADLVQPMVNTLQRAVDWDMVNHPPHYTAGKVECIDALEAATVGLTGIDAVCTAAAIKYLWRWKQKGGTEDLKKARWYINRLLGESA